MSSSQYGPYTYGIPPTAQPSGPLTMSALRYANGDTYRGEVGRSQNNAVLPYGRGVYYYTNGQVFMGTFTWNIANGPGRMQYANGDVFEGIYVNDERHGFGRYYSNMGGVVEGYWQRDRFVQVTNYRQPGQYSGARPTAALPTAIADNTYSRGLGAPAPVTSSNPQFPELPFMY